MNHRSSAPVLTALMLALSVGATVSAQPQPAPKRTAVPATPPASTTPPQTPDKQPGKEDRPAPADLVPLSGVVDYFNISPRGTPDSIMLVTGDGLLVQLNFPPELSRAFAGAVKTGEKITASASLAPHHPQLDGDDDRPGRAEGMDRDPKDAPADSTAKALADASIDHPVYIIDSLTNAAGQTIDRNSPHDPSFPLKGSVKRFNFSPAGSVNGFALDDGTVVLLPPWAASRLHITIGENLTGEAFERYSDPKLGLHLVEAFSVNGEALRPNPRPAPGPAKHPGDKKSDQPAPAPR